MRHKGSNIQELIILEYFHQFNRRIEYQSKYFYFNKMKKGSKANFKKKADQKLLNSTKEIVATELARLGNKNVDLKDLLNYEPRITLSKEQVQKSKIIRNVPDIYSDIDDIPDSNQDILLNSQEVNLGKEMKSMKDDSFFKATLESIISEILSEDEPVKFIGVTMCYDGSKVDTRDKAWNQIFIDQKRVLEFLRDLEYTTFAYCCIEVNCGTTKQIKNQDAILKKSENIANRKAKEKANLFPEVQPLEEVDENYSKDNFIEINEKKVIFLEGKGKAFDIGEFDELNQGFNILDVSSTSDTDCKSDSYKTLIPQNFAIEKRKHHPSFTTFIDEDYYEKIGQRIGSDGKMVSGSNSTNKTYSDTSHQSIKKEDLLKFKTRIEEFERDEQILRSNKEQYKSNMGSYYSERDRMLNQKNLKIKFGITFCGKALYVDSLTGFHSNYVPSETIFEKLGFTPDFEQSYENTGCHLYIEKERYIGYVFRNAYDDHLELDDGKSRYGWPHLHLVIGIANFTGGKIDKHKLHTGLSKIMRDTFIGSRKIQFNIDNGEDPFSLIRYVFKNYNHKFLVDLCGEKYLRRGIFALYADYPKMVNFVRDLVCKGQPIFTSSNKPPIINYMKQINPKKIYPWYKKRFDENYNCVVPDGVKILRNGNILTKKSYTTNSDEIIFRRILYFLEKNGYKLFDGDVYEKVPESTKTYNLLAKKKDNAEIFIDTLSKEIEFGSKKISTYTNKFRSEIYKSVICSDLGFLGAVELQDGFMFLHSGKMLRKSHMEYLSHIYLPKLTMDDIINYDLGKVPDCLENFIGRIFEPPRMMERIKYLTDALNGKDIIREEVTKDIKSEIKHELQTEYRISLNSEYELYSFLDRNSGYKITQFQQELDTLNLAVVEKKREHVEKFKILAYELFLPHQRKAPCPYIYGPKNSGKTTIISRIVNLIPAQFLGSMTKSNFGLASLKEHTRVIIVDDGSSSVNFKDNTLLNILEGGRISLERKGVDPTDIYVSLNFVFCTNNTLSSQIKDLDEIKRDAVHIRIEEFHVSELVTTPIIDTREKIELDSSQLFAYLAKNYFTNGKLRREDYSLEILEEKEQIKKYMDDYSTWVREIEEDKYRNV